MNAIDDAVEPCLTSLAAAMERQPVPTVILESPGGRILHANRPAVTLFGSAEALEAWFGSGDAGPFPLAGDAFRGGARAFRSDGGALWLKALEDRVEIDGLAARLVNLFDITPFVEASRAAEHSEGLTRAIVDTASDAIVTMDAQGSILTFNRGAERIFQFHAEEVCDQNLALLMPQRLRALHESGLRRYLAEGNPHVIGKTVEVVGQRRDGSEFPVELSIAEVPNPASPIFAGILRDISARKRVERELEHARSAAEAANEAKSAFLATMSHEIRTPMNGVIGMTDLLLDSELSTEQREMVHTIRDSGESLLVIINDILDYSKIEAGRLELEEHPYDIRLVVESVLDLLGPKAAEKSIALAGRVADDVAAGLLGDSTRMRQVFLNLLTNAIKFTEKGEVELQLRLADPSSSRLAPTADPSRTQALHIVVRDTGIGIAPENLNRLFKSFSQVDASVARRYGGSGLGLAITRRIVELMGGSAWCESPGRGRGATFHVELPVSRAPGFRAREHMMPDQPRLRTKRVLIVDEDGAHRRVLADQLRAWNMLPHATAEQAQALEWLEKRCGFDIAIADPQILDDGGATLAAALRMPGTKRVPLVMQRAVGGREASTPAVEAEGVAVKPLKPSQLYDTLVGLFAEEAGSLGPAPAIAHPAERSPAVRPLRILLAEDNAVNQQIALRFLRRLGYEADVAENGHEVIGALDRARYDLVFMDIQMPEMDGLEATKRILERWPGPDRPWIVAMTANAMEGDRERYLSAGMNDYVSKPIRPGELERAIGAVPGADERADPAP